MHHKITSLIVLLVLTLAVPLFAQSTGESLFTSYCISCHGHDLSGKTTFGVKHNIPDLRTPVVQHLSDQELMLSIGRGQGHKDYPHAFLARGLSTVQVQSIISYIRSMAIKTPASGQK